MNVAQLMGSLELDLLTPETDLTREVTGGCVCDLTKAGNYKAVVANLLEAKGLNYGQLPKGLLLFHQYKDGPRTPMEEHLVEAALYASTNGNANIHFTVSHDHLELFKKKWAYVGQKLLDR